jgi:ParB-like chromosome segregation protein Spo0J
MKTEYSNLRMDTARLIPYAKNSRTHSEIQVGQIAASIKEWGFTNPIIIDEDNGIIAGHGRLLAAQKLGLKDVPCVQVTGWSDAQKKAYVIADNKLALNAGWDDDMLRLELEDLQDMDFDVELLGFDADEMDALLYSGVDFDAGTLEDQGKLDELAPKMVTCPQCGESFDSRGREQ